MTGFSCRSGLSRSVQRTHGPRQPSPQLIRIVRLHRQVHATMKPKKPRPRPPQPILTSPTSRYDVYLHPMAVSDEHFSTYARAFHAAARALVRVHSQQNAARDIELIPALFLYRHSLELHSKAVLVAGNRLLTAQGQQRIRRTSL
jgi:hypothetical protein